MVPHSAVIEDHLRQLAGRQFLLNHAYELLERVVAFAQESDLHGRDIIQHALGIVRDMHAADSDGNLERRQEFTDRSERDVGHREHARHADQLRREVVHRVGELLLPDRVEVEFLLACRFAAGLENFVVQIEDPNFDAHLAQVLSEDRQTVRRVIRVTSALAVS